MFCSNCGSEITDNQKFCCHCGSENRNYMANSGTQIIHNNVYSPVHTNTIFNHDVLVNYLNNVRTLEFAKNKLTNEKNNLEYRINDLGHKREIPKRLTDFETPLCCIGIMAFIFIVALVIKILINSGDWLFSWLNFIQPVLTFALWGTAIITIFCLIWIIYDETKDQKRYVNETNFEEERIKSELYEKENLSEILSEITRDLTQTETLLDKAYDINLIPQKYRNIYAAYFLYDYISTSNVNLNEALFHCDLDEISKKLDTIIEQQREIIMELARSNALNEQIIRQNEETLKHAIAAENNTALAAQYSQVAAVNTNTIATIQSYYFFKDGL